MIRFNDTHILAGHIKQMLKEFELPRYRAGKWQGIDEPGYYFGKRVRNYTRNLQMRSNSYDSYTHEYLGWYLRFVRDYKGIDLMPLYNCFSERACSNIDIEVVSGNKIIEVSTDDSSCKIYSMPIQLGKTYTIAMDSEQPVEIMCALIGYYQTEDQRGIPSLTYKKYNTMSFQSPEVFKTDVIEDLDLGAEEANLKLVMKMPADNESSIVVLEGDYSGWNDVLLTQTAKDEDGAKKYSWETMSNNYVTNFDSKEIRDVSPSKKVAEKDGSSTTYRWEYSNVTPLDHAGGEGFRPITPLQLLRINTNISYPFADRLVEYLVDNAITPDDELNDNIVRAQRVMKMNNKGSEISNFKIEGFWEDKMRAIAYEYMQFDNKNGNDKNHDILGYIDKDVETLYSAVEMKEMWQNGAKVKKIIRHTIANEDIYDTMYTDDKEG